MASNRIIFIQAGVLAAQRLEERVGGSELNQDKLVRSRDYLFFPWFEESVVMPLITEGHPQLILTSHDDDRHDANEIAKIIKTKNPAALVIAYTGSFVTYMPRTMLDGLITKGGGSFPEGFVRQFCLDFLRGTPARELLARVLRP